MSRIIVLDDSLISKIAAGEVVERPVSVVKELVENSIDAGAKRIIIEIEKGGKKLIRVSDDGSGMTGEEAKLSFERHSTSKIKTLDDLFRIKTLGFRGEALPSIASISRLVMTTANGEAGTELQLEGGKLKEEKEVGCPAGTTFEVRDLFFNTPARLKYLKTDITELSHIVNIVTKLIIAHPEIAFKLARGKEEILSSVGSGKLLDALVSVYGAGVARDLKEVNFAEDRIQIKGYVGNPQVSRAARSDESFFVNGRYVRSILLSQAVEGVYRTLIPGNRYPLVILFFDLSPNDVDVNVHPAKREVRFARVSDVLQSSAAAIKEALGDTFKEMKEVITEGGVEFHPIQPTTFDLKVGKQAGKLAEIMSEQVEDSGINPLIQISNTYIVVQNKTGFAVVDQHAAHERILYDQLTEKGETFESQNLLLAETLQSTAEEALILGENMNSFKELGFVIEPFGKDTFVVRAVPPALGKGSALPVISDILAEIKNLGKSTKADVVKEKIRKLVACHGAVKAGDKLLPEEIRKLMRDLFNTKNPHTCPHGRPTMVEITQEELEKRFMRR